MPDPAAQWPELPFPAWSGTCDTLQLWTQIVGKIRLALTPWLNHSWHVPLYVTARGLGTSPIPIGDESFEIDFDFIGHRLVVRTSRGEEAGVPLAPQTVAEFYRRTFEVLNRLRGGRMIDGVAVRRRETTLDDREQTVDVIHHAPGVPYSRRSP